MWGLNLKWGYIFQSLWSILYSRTKQHTLILKLEQLERLRSEHIPRRLMITDTIESYWIPSQKKTKSKLQI